MWRKNYKSLEELEKELVNKRITEFAENKITLEDGTEVTIECSEQDCCAWAGGEFKNVKLDAMITFLRITETSSTCISCETTNYATVTIFHNCNPIAQADCHADDGNGGYYYSVCSLVVKNIHYPVVEA